MRATDVRYVWLRLPMLVRFLFPISFALALDVYGYFAVRKLVTDEGGRTPRWFQVVWWTLPIVMIVYMIAVANDGDGALQRGGWVLFRSAILIAYFSKFIIAGFLLLDDVRRLLQAVVGKLVRSISSTKLAQRSRQAFWPDRSKFLTQFAVLAGGLPAVVLTYGIVRNPYRYRIHELDVPIKGLSPKLQGFRIAQISDIHSGSFFREHPIADGIRALNDLGPDVACFTGDLVNSRATEIEPYIDVFSKVEARHGTFSIIGNHDYGDYVAGWTPEDKAANWQTLYENHRKLGWKLLLNEHAVINHDGEPLAMVGVENWSAIPRFPRTGDLLKASAGTEGIATKVLLSHDPTHWDAEVVAQRPDLQLQLSGHTHGFQFGVEIPGFRWSPSQYVYEQWAGLYTKGNQHLYVNRGYGFLGYPGRVGILPEVTLIRLVAA